MNMCSPMPAWFPGANAGVTLSRNPPCFPLPGHFWWDGKVLHMWDGIAWQNAGAGPPGPLPGLGVNIKTDFCAVGDGITNDAPAFNAFNAWARAQANTSITLLIPPGTYAGFTPGTATPAAFGCDFFCGIKDLTVMAYGATVPFLRGPNTFNVNPNSPITVWASIQTVQSSSTSVTLITPAETSQFAVGNWVAVTSLEMQGNGFPPNFYYVDYVRISAINASTGVITFESPLNFTHNSTYPVTTLWPGYAGTPGQLGGPASVFLMHPDWDQNLRIYGLNVVAANAPGNIETNLGMRRGRFVDCNFNCNIAPTCNMFAEYESCYFHGGIIEVDKNINHLKFTDCRIVSLTLQSASDDVVVDGCHIDTIADNCKRLVVRNSYVSAPWNLTPPTVGANKTLIIENCNIANLSTTADINYLLLSNLTFSNGTFSIPLTSPQITFAYRLAIPGSKCFFNSNFWYNLGSPFIILRVYQDTVNLYFDTTLTALPTFTGPGTGAPGICQHSAPRFIASGNTGNDTAVMTGKQQKELPVYSYAHKVYSEDLVMPSWPTPVTQQVMQWGTLVSLKVNVIRPDTGPVVPLFMHPLGQFGANVVSPTGALGPFDLTIDLKSTGLRTITPTTVTGNVGGDAIVAPGLVWFVQYGLHPWLSASIAANTAVQCPIVEIELITDQGVTAFELTVQ